MEAKKINTIFKTPVSGNAHTMKFKIKFDEHIKMSLSVQTVFTWLTLEFFWE